MPGVNRIFLVTDILLSAQWLRDTANQVAPSVDYCRET